MACEFLFLLGLLLIIYKSETKLTIRRKDDYFNYIYLKQNNILLSMKSYGIPCLITLSLTALSLQSCGDTQGIEQNVIDEEVFNPNNSMNTIFNDKIFSIPSPVQTAFLIKELNLEYDSEIGNETMNGSSYISEYQQSLNLGVYGADMGYSALYDQKNITLNYLAVIQNITNELGLDAAFDKSFLDKFASNADDDQEMIELMSEAFKQADNFLKQSNRKDVSAWILTGGWIESMHIACHLNGKVNNISIQKRIGEQKQTINTIVDILKEYNTENINDSLIAELEDLNSLFKKVKITYDYVAPETDKVEKITVLRHGSDVRISKTLLSEIKSKISSVRTLITKS